MCWPSWQMVSMLVTYIELSFPLCGIYVLISGKSVCHVLCKCWWFVASCGLLMLFYNAVEIWLPLLSFTVDCSSALPFGLVHSFITNFFVLTLQAVMLYKMWTSDTRSLGGLPILRCPTSLQLHWAWFLKPRLNLTRRFTMIMIVMGPGTQQSRDQNHSHGSCNSTTLWFVTRELMTLQFFTWVLYKFCLLIVRCGALSFWHDGKWLEFWGPDLFQTGLVSISFIDRPRRYESPVSPALASTLAFSEALPKFPKFARTSTNGFVQCRPSARCPSSVMY